MQVVPFLGRYLMVLLTQAVAKDVSDIELARAKKAAVSSVLMNLESRAVVAEDIGRQVLTYGHRQVQIERHPSKR